MKTFVVFVLALGTSGCTMIGKSYRPDPIPLPKYAWYTAPTRFKDGAVDWTKLSQVQAPCSLPTAASCARNARNRALNDLMTLSDQLCTVHMANIMSNASTWNVTTGTITNLLAGVASLGSNSASQANYAAGAVFSNSSRSLVNSEVYMQTLASTVVRAMETLRSERRDAIALRMKNEDEVSYTLENGFREVQRYHEACSFYVGISEVTRAVEKRADQKDSAQLQILQLQTTRHMLVAADATANQDAIDKIDKQVAALIETMTKASQ